METINVLKVDTQAAQTSIKELRKQLKQYKDEMAGLEEGSDAFNSVANKAGALQHQLSAINNTIRGASADFGDILGNSIKVTNGIIGGFTAAQGALNAFGLESDEVGEAIKRLQGFMAIGQGISQIDAATKAFAKLDIVVKLNNKSLSGFKKALIGTGLGAFIVILGTIIENWDAINEKIKEFTGDLDLAKTATAAFDSAWTALKTTIVAVGNAIVTYIKTPFETVVNGIKAFYETDGSVVDKLKAGVSAMKNTVVDNFKDVKDDFVAIGTETSKAFNDSIDRQNKEAEQKRREEAKKAADERAKIKQEQLSEERKQAEEQLAIEEERLKRETDLTEKERIQRQIEIEQKRLELLKKYGLEGTLEYEKQLTQIHSLQQELLKPEEQKEEKQPEDPVIKKLIEEANAYKESLKTQEEILTEKRALVQSYYEQGLIDEKTYQNQLNQIAQRSAEMNNQILQGKINASLDMADTFANLFGAIASNMDETNKKQFEAAKAFNIASATISTITGAIDAYMGAQKNPAYQLVPGLAVAMGVIQAATVTAAGIAQIRKIASQKYETSSIGGTVSSSAVQSTVIPPVQYSQAVQGAQTERTISEQQTNTRVYVLESDITKTTNKVNVAQSNATF